MKNYAVQFCFTMLLCSTLTIGCDKDDEPEPVDTSASDIAETSLTAKADQTTEAMSDLVLQAYEVEENTTSYAKSMKKAIIVARKRLLPDCATVTVSDASKPKTLTIDFGSEGCKTEAGDMVKGKMMISYEKDASTLSRLINYTLQDFYINEIKLEGNKTITRKLENANGNPEYTMNLDLKLTFENGTQATRTGSKTRAWTEGKFDGDWKNNAFKITGEWKTVFANGNSHAAKITSPLQRKANCRHLVSGVINIVRTNFSGDLDYGDGSCDNLATFKNTEGREIEIKL